jgi:aminoglycoside phosphotransferase (APT) family kinase protein
VSAVRTDLPPDSVEVPDVGLLEVNRAWPREPGHVLLELRGADVVLAAQWWSGSQQLAATASRYARTPARVHDGVLVHLGGADRKLVRLQADLDAPGAQLVGHRAERRAVVRRADGSYVKHVRPHRVEDVALGLASADRLVGSVAVVPTVEPVDPAAGTAVLAAVEGRTLLELGEDAISSPTELAAAWRAAGRVTAALHAAHPSGLSQWTTEDEVRSAQRLVHPATAAGLLPSCGWRPLYDAVLALPRMRGVPVHRDLHDKQLLWDGKRLGLIDCDTLAAGDPAADVANVLAHLQLRQAQGVLSASRASSAASDFLAALDPTPQVLARVGAYRSLTTLRLAALYAWRPRWRHLVRPLLQSALDGRPPR